MSGRTRVPRARWRQEGKAALPAATRWKLCSRHPAHSSHRRAGTMPPRTDAHLFPFRSRGLSNVLQAGTVPAGWDHAQGYGSPALSHGRPQTAATTTACRAAGKQSFQTTQTSPGRACVLKGSPELQRDADTEKHLPATPVVLRASRDPDPPQVQVKQLLGLTHFCIQ